MNPLGDFFEEERKRVFTPGPFFTRQVMARLNKDQVRDADLWDIVPGSARQLFAGALILIVCLFVMQLSIPQTPRRGPVEAYLATEQSDAETLLYNQVDLLRGEDVLRQVITLEEPR